MPQLRPEMISRFPDRQREIEEDDLMDKGPFRLYSGDSMLAMTQRIQNEAANLRVPFVVIHGTGDVIIPISGSHFLVEESATPDDLKEIIVIEGAYHDIMTELFEADMQDRVLEWIDFRIE